MRQSQNLPATLAKPFGKDMTGYKDFSESHQPPQCNQMKKHP
jgi:hypothetical protein